MSEMSSTRSPAVFMLLGSVLTLAILGIGWAVWRVAAPGEGARPPAQPTITALSDQPGGALSNAATSADVETAPPTSPDDEAPSADAGASVETAPKVAAAQAGDASKAAPVESPDAEAAEAAAEDARQAETDRELAYVKSSFEERKRQFMEIIDNYFNLPIEERPDYLPQAFQNLARIDQEERAAQGLPPRPRDRRVAMGGFLRMLGSSATEEEKTKVRTFIGDVMQMQMARIRAQIDEQMGGDKAKEETTPYHP